MRGWCVWLLNLTPPQFFFLLLLPCHMGSHTHRLQRISLGYFWTISTRLFAFQTVHSASFCFPDPPPTLTMQHKTKSHATRNSLRFVLCAVKISLFGVLPFRVLTPTHDVKLLVSSQRYSAVKPLNVKTRLVSTHAYARRHTRTRTTPKRTRRSAKATGTNIKSWAV